MSLIDMKTIAEVAKSDPEFTRETRYLNGIVKFGVADEEYLLRFDNGKLISVELGTNPDSECKIVVRGTREHWLAMLEKYPKPFYQCLQSTSVKHGLQLSVSNETFAYLPALNRMTTLMRQTYNKESRA